MTHEHPQTLVCSSSLRTLAHTQVIHHLSSEQVFGGTIMGRIMGTIGAIMAHLPRNTQGGIGGHARACLFLYKGPEPDCDVL
jgi:hypothetical protein